MTQLIDSAKEIFYHLRQYKARTFMTMFGIIWGTVTVILLLAFGTGLGRKLMKDMHGLGEGIAIVWPGQTSIPFKGYSRNRPIRLRTDDIELLRQRVSGLEAISPEYSKWGVPVRLGKMMNKPTITGMNMEYGYMRNIYPQPGGRWIDNMDIKNRRRVVFLGNRLKDYLFGEKTNAIGQYVYIGETPFVVIGVLKEKTQDSSYNSRDQDRAFIPYTTFESIFGNKYINNMIYKHRDPHFAKENEKKVYEVLAQKYTFDPNDRETLGIWDTYESEKFMRDFNTSFSTFLGVIGGISLLIGGLGLANIMYVVVQERTHEIGIRRSAGAKKRHIMGHFFMETFIIIGFGASIGFIIAISLIKLINMFPIYDYVGKPVLSISVALVTVLVLSLVGFFAGFFPARKAANLDPVECLRY